MWGEGSQNTTRKKITQKWQNSYAQYVVKKTIGRTSNNSLSIKTRDVEPMLAQHWNSIGSSIVVLLWISVFASPWIVVFFLPERKWNESGFRQPLCTYMLNWARRTSCGWEVNETTLSSRHRIQNSEAEHTTSRLQRLTTMLSFTRERTWRWQRACMGMQRAIYTPMSEKFP